MPRIEPETLFDEPWTTQYGNPCGVLARSYWMQQNDWLLGSNVGRLCNACNIANGLDE